MMMIMIFLAVIGSPVLPAQGVELSLDGCGEQLAVTMTSNPLSSFEDGKEVARVNLYSRVELVATATGGVPRDGKYVYLWYRDRKAMGQVQIAEQGQLILSANLEDNGADYHCVVLDFSESDWRDKVAKYLAESLN